MIKIAHTLFLLRQNDISLESWDARTIGKSVIYLECDTIEHLK